MNSNTDIKKYAAFVVIIIAVIFTIIITQIPYDNQFGKRSSAKYYIDNGLEGTGSANIVNSIVWDFRGYDTLGEETVLFTAASGVYFLAYSLRKKGKDETEVN